MAEKIVRLGAYANPLEAELAKNRLTAAGIRAFLAGGATGGLFAGLGGAFGTVDLHVYESDLERASEILASAEEELPLEENEAAGWEEDSTAIEEHAPRSARRGSAIQDHLPEAADDSETEFDREGPVEPQEGEEESWEKVPEISIQWTAEALAGRALRAAIIGLVLFPPILHLYSLWILIRMAFLGGGLSPSGMRKVAIALAVDLGVLFLILLVLRAMALH
jgi:hypothetical protein